MNGILLPYVHIGYLLWKLLELKLFCSRDLENCWHRAQVLHGSSYYVNSRSLHFSQAFFSPFTYTKQTGNGASMICPKPWRQNKVPGHSFSKITFIMEAYAPINGGESRSLPLHCTASAKNTYQEG